MKVLALSALVCTVMALNAAAEEGWQKISSRHFTYIPRKMSWGDAESNCVWLGGHLASIHTSTQHRALKNLIKKNANWNPGVWIGGTDISKDDVWRWSDGSPFKYSSWCPGEPNTFLIFSVQRCLQMNYSDRKCWDNIECFRELPSICVKE